MSLAGISIQEIASFLGVDSAGTPTDTRIMRVAAIEGADSASIVFAQDGETLDLAKLSSAGLILATIIDPADNRVLQVSHPRLALSKVYARWFDRRGQAGIARSASIHAEALIGEACEIGEGAVIEAGVSMGRDCIIGHRVVIHSGTTLGDRVRIQSGAVLGSDGFGYAADGGTYLGFPQIGTLRIGNDVEVGANVTIDRGALGETAVGRGTKIDNLVHIAHNCQIGEDVLIAAQVGIAGSTQVGNGAILGGQVGIGDRVVIGPGVILGAQAGIPTSKRLTGAGKVFWGTPARPIKEYLRDLARLKRG